MKTIRFGVIGLVLVGCTTQSHLTLSQSKEHVSNKPKVSVRTNDFAEEREKETFTMPSLPVTKTDRAKESKMLSQKDKAQKGTEVVNAVIESNNKGLKELNNPLYTIQLVALKDHRGFEPYIKQLSPASPLWMNEKKVKGSAFFALLYGEFSSKEEAQLELKKLPEGFIDNGAFIRSFSSIEKSMHPKLEPIFR